MTKRYTYECRGCSDEASTQEVNWAPFSGDAPSLVAICDDCKTGMIQAGCRFLGDYMDLMNGKYDDEESEK